MPNIQQANKSVATISEAAREFQRLSACLPEGVETFLANIPNQRTADDLWPYGRPKVTPDEEKGIREIIAAMEFVSLPAERAQILGHVTKIMHHSFLLDIDERLWDEIFDDWVEDLREYPAWCIAEACRQWRRAKPGKKPGPGHIRRLCWMIFDRECLTLQALKQLVDGLPPRPVHVKLSWRHDPRNPVSDSCGPKWVDEFGRPVTRTGELLDIIPYEG